MKIEYTTPSTECMKVIVCTTSQDEETSDVMPSKSALCTYTPEPYKGIKEVPVGRFKAIGDNGRVEEATVIFDLRKGEFVIRPKQLVSEGFDFDKPVVVGEPAKPETPAAAPVIAVQTPAMAGLAAKPVETPPMTRPHRKVGETP